MSFRISSFVMVGEVISNYEEMQKSTFGITAALKATCVKGIIKVS